MLIKVTLIDSNPKVVDAWRYTFEDNPEVDIVHGSMLTQNTSAWVSPTNARGNMDVGLDAIIKNFLGVKIEKCLQQEIAKHYHGSMPIGYATCFSTGTDWPRFLISTTAPTASADNGSDSFHVALACAAAFQAVHMQNAREPGSIRSVALPGIGASTGVVSVENCADLMWNAYDLFRRREFSDFQAMRGALKDKLSEVGLLTENVAAQA